MSMATSHEVLRPAPGGLKAWVTARVLALLPLGFRLLRAVRPILRFGNMVVVTRYDDVREVFLNDKSFRVPYKEKLDVIMGGLPFFLGMDDTLDYRRDTDAMRQVVRATDIPARLVPRVEQLGEEIVAANPAGTPLEVVDALVRRITFQVYQEYFGIPDPAGQDLQVMATRLFEFQFADPGNDPALRTEVDVFAPRLREHIRDLMAKRRLPGAPFQDDVLGRCIDMNAKGTPGFDDDHILTALMGFIVGGPPQPPMVVPQAMEQLLRRPDALAGAQEAARRNDDTLLAGYVFEAMRFDPLAPALPRVATKATSIAAATPRATAVPQGANVLVAFSSAMMDERRVADPGVFNPVRPANDYIHFGYGLHQCFGIHMNKALLHLMLKALLKCKGLRRAPGAAGHLLKRGAFADKLFVCYD
jgi:cytochrome P450